MDYKIRVSSIWELGQRVNQEDSIYPRQGEMNDAGRLFVLCDGMGGHSAGEIASSTVCAAMSAYILSHAGEGGRIFSDEDFYAALDAAYDALDEHDDGAPKKMGTTLAFLKFHEDGCTIAHIGDSRVYHIRPAENPDGTEILFRTEDHSAINELVKAGALTPEEAKLSKQKNVITRAMQPHMGRRDKADLYHCCDIRPGDFFMLCSDGMLEQMEDQNIKYIFSGKGGDISNKTDILTKSTAENRDNHSAILIEIVDVEGVVPLLDENPAKANGKTMQGPEISMAQAEAPEESGRPRRHGPARYLLSCIFCAAFVFGCFCVYRLIRPGQAGVESPGSPEPPSVMNAVPAKRKARPVSTPKQEADAVHPSAGSTVPATGSTVPAAGSTVPASGSTVPATGNVQDMPQRQEPASDAVGDSTAAASAPVPASAPAPASAASPASAPTSAPAQDDTLSAPASSPLSVSARRGLDKVQGRRNGNIPTSADTDAMDIANRKRKEK